MNRALFFALCSSLALTAARTAGAQSTDTSRLRTVIVSATKAEAPGSALTQAVTVISGNDLRARGVTRVTDALREVPGAALVQSGSFGAVTSLFLRGGESRYTKILIDGVPVNAPGGFFDLSHLTTDNIDRIEIVRGPASVLYGADAVSGVVQIFTKRARVGLTHDESFRAGTYRSRDAIASVTSGTPSVGFSLGGGAHTTKGIVPFNNQYLNGTLSSSLRAAREGLGVAFLSAYAVAEEIERGELDVFRLRGRRPLTRDFQIARLASRPLSPAESAFVATLTRCCAKQSAYAEACVATRL